MTAPVTPFSLKDAPALIERLLPVQKLSAESYKEQEGRQSKTLTPLGSYWPNFAPRSLNLEDAARISQRFQGSDAASH